MSKTIEQQVEEFTELRTIAKDENHEGEPLLDVFPNVDTPDCGIVSFEFWFKQALQERDRIAYERGREFERERIESTYAKYYDWYFRAYHSHVMKDFDGFPGDNSMWDKLISEIGDAK